MDPHAQMKQGMRWMWSLGDYEELAPILEPVDLDDESQEDHDHPEAGRTSGGPPGHHLSAADRVEV